MKIDAVSIKLPSRQVTNSEILDEIKKRSEAIYTEDLEELLHSIDSKLNASGIKTRFIYKDDEPWYPRVKSAVDDVLRTADCHHDEIGCVVYSSVYRTVYEPSMASLLAKSFQMQNALSFDVNEACAGWVRAVTIANAMFKGGFKKKILVIGNEANHRENSKNYAAFALRKKEDLEWAFPTFTIGAAATATLLSADPSREWFMDFDAKNAFSDYTLHPLELNNPVEHQIGDIDTRGMGLDVFTCYGRKLQIHGGKYFVRFLERSRDRALAADIILPHTQTSRGYFDLFSKKLKVKTPIHSVYPKYGNIVTCSLPGTLADALTHHLVKRGDRVYMAIPASGLSMSAMSFVF